MYVTFSSTKMNLIHTPSIINIVACEPLLGNDRETSYYTTSITK
jgi:hypothetical protein